MPSRERSRFSGMFSESRTADPTPSAPMMRSASADSPLANRIVPSGLAPTTSEPATTSTPASRAATSSVW